jgi:hypothetical protein
MSVRRPACSLSRAPPPAAACMRPQSGYREGLDEGKGVLIQQGFNAGARSRGLARCLYQHARCCAMPVACCHLLVSAAARRRPHMLRPPPVRLREPRFSLHSAPRAAARGFESLLNLGPPGPPVPAAPLNPGFTEGAAAGFEFGLARGALQTLSILLKAHAVPPAAAAAANGSATSSSAMGEAGPAAVAAAVGGTPGPALPAAAARAEALRSELSSVPPKMAMARACLEILGTQPLNLETRGDAELEEALEKLRVGPLPVVGDGSGGSGGAIGAAIGGSGGAAGGGAASAVASGKELAEGAKNGGSWAAYMKRLARELQELGCEVGGAPPPPPLPLRRQVAVAAGPAGGERPERRPEAAAAAAAAAPRAGRGAGERGEEEDLDELGW